MMTVSGFKHFFNSDIDGVNASGTIIKRRWDLTRKSPEISGTFFSSFDLVDATDKFPPTNHLSHKSLNGIDRYVAITLRAGNRRALVERFKQAPSGELAHRIPEVSVPTLILWGGHDRLIPPDSGERFQRHIKGSQLVVFDHLGHVPHEEDPIRTVAAVKRFLAIPGKSHQ